MYFLGMIGAQREHSVKALFLLNSVKHHLFLGCIASAEERCGLLADGHTSLPLKQLGDPPGSGWNFTF